MIKVVSYVIWIGHTCVIRLMTGIAIGGGAGIGRRVTSNTSHGSMGADQRESGIVMLKGRRQPGRGSVACCANVIKVVCLVIRIGYDLEIGLVTAITSRRSANIPGCVAGNTSRSSMRPVSGKAVLL